MKVTRTEDFVTDRLESWILWRNMYTEPGKQPLNVLYEELECTPESAQAAYRYKYPVCPHCHGAGIVKDDNDKVYSCICTVLKENDMIKNEYKDIRTPVRPAYLRDIKYPKDMEEPTKRDLKRAVDAAVSFIKHPIGKWLIIQGSYGVGKTHILRAINTALWPMAVYISAGEFETLMHTYRKGDELSSFYKKLQTAPILLIDDVGMEYGGQLFSTAFDKIVDYRYSMFPSMPLVVATNYSRKNFPSIMSSRSADRLADKAITRSLGINGISFRERNVEDRNG